jgi:hypothetical protein
MVPENLTEAFMKHVQEPAKRIPVMAETDVLVVAEAVPAVSLKNKVTCRKVDISRVQKALKKQGVRIE